MSSSSTGSTAAELSGGTSPPDDSAFDVGFLGILPFFLRSPVTVTRLFGSFVASGAESDVLREDFPDDFLLAFRASSASSDTELALDELRRTFALTELDRVTRFAVDDLRPGFLVDDDRLESVSSHTAHQSR